MLLINPSGFQTLSKCGVWLEKREAGEVFATPQNSPSPPYCHLHPHVPLQRVQISRFQPQTSHLAPGRGSGLPTQLGLWHCVCHSIGTTGTGSSAGTAIPPNNRPKYIPAMEKGRIQAGATRSSHGQGSRG